MSLLIGQDYRRGPAVYTAMVFYRPSAVAFLGPHCGGWNSESRAVKTEAGAKPQNRLIIPSYKAWK